jgi:hypothetical protein
MDRLSTFLRYALADGVPRRSLIAAAVVGTLLNVINQGDALAGAKPLNVTKLILTFIVPYCVATYGAVSYQMTHKPPEND